MLYKGNVNYGNYTEVHDWPKYELLQHKAMRSKCVTLNNTYNLVQELNMGIQREQIIEPSQWFVLFFLNNKKGQ